MHLRIMDLQEQVPLGIMRELIDGCCAMVLIVWPYVACVYDGSYKPPREQLGGRCFTCGYDNVSFFHRIFTPLESVGDLGCYCWFNMARAHPFIGSEGPGASY